MGVTSVKEVFTIDEYCEGFGHTVACAKVEGGDCAEAGGKFQMW